MSSSPRMDPKAARHALTDHPYYRYRGCAPDPDDPRMAAGDPGLPVTSWESPDMDGGEPQLDRLRREAAAKAVCAGCPVKAACAAVGASLTRDGQLAERHAILGGETALERGRALVKERHGVPLRPAPERQLRTEQKLAVLHALAAWEAPEDVARAAGLDVRTANWQRARLITQLGLPKAASRREVLRAAVAWGLLDADEVPDQASAAPAPCARRSRVRRFTVLPGQLSLDDLITSATVTELATRTAFLEAAAA